MPRTATPDPETTLHLDSPTAAAPQTAPTTTTRSDQAWARARALLGSAVVGAAAVAAAPALADAQAPAEPTLQYGGSVSANHNSSGWFTSDAHSGSADGRVFGTLAEGVKLYGESTLAREDYMFNTWGPHPEYGWYTYRSTSTGLAMAWWGTATGLRANAFDTDTGDLTRAGDSLAFHYEFSVTGPAGTSWHLRGGFTDQLYFGSNAGLLQPNLYSSADAYGSLGSDGSQSFAGALSTDSLDHQPAGPVYWLITLSADLPYDPSQGLRLFVPQHSIDAGVNQAPLASAVPEPGTWALWLAGMAVLGGMARQRRSAALSTRAGD